MKKWIFSAVAAASIYFVYKAASPTPQVVLLGAELSSENLNYAHSLGFKDAYVIYDWDLDRNNDGLWDGPAQYDAWLNYYHLGVDFTGYVALDHEGRAGELLGQRAPGIMDDWLKLLTYAKMKTPKAKIGFYGFPEVAMYSNGANIDDAHSSELQERIKYTLPIMQASTALYPSIYFFYTADQFPDAHESQVAYARWNTKNILKWNEQLKKPIYPFVWHRIHECCTPIPAILTTRDIFKDQMRVILKTSLNSKKVDGVIWWSSDLYQLSETMRDASHPPLWLTVECGNNSVKWRPCIDKTHRDVITDFSLVLNK